MRIAVLLLLFVTCPVASAQVNRWVDEKGTVNYSSGKPPPGVKSTLVDIEAKSGPPSADSTECHTVRCQGERMEQRLARREEAEARAIAQRPPPPPPMRGLAFRNYVSLQRGMTEGELIGYAGPPDLLFRDRHIVTYTYMPTVPDPFTTVITVSSGRIAEIERIRKF